MRIAILTDRMLKRVRIATVQMKQERVIDRLVSFLKSTGKHDIYLVGAHITGVAGVHTTKTLPQDAAAIDLNYLYDDRKLKRAIQKGKKDVSSAIIVKNSLQGHIKNMGCLFQRKEWNPLSKYYVEPLGEWLGTVFYRTPLTANMVTSLNILLSSAAALLLFLPGWLPVIAFGIWIRLAHALDIMDGQIARLQNKQSPFGGWFDGVGDRIFVSIWYIAIAVRLFNLSTNIWYLYLGFAVLLGLQIYSYSLITSVVSFRSGDFRYKTEDALARNPLIRIFLSFSAIDIHYHLLTLAALANRLEWFLIFYAVYFNLLWMAYLGYYSLRHMRSQAKEN